MSPTMTKGQALRFTFAKTAQLPLGWRLHQTVRALLAPFEALVEHLPDSGLLVDVGCGHGLFLLLSRRARPRLRLIGFDLSPSKVFSAQKLLAGAGGDVELFVGDVAELPDASADAISIIDVLYLIPTERWPEVLARCFAKLRPGGRLLLKEMDPTERLKLSLLRLEEWLAVRVFGWTLSDSGQKFSFPSRQAVDDMLAQAGFSVRNVPLSARSFAPHHLWFATKPNFSS
jgi:SAM-dependent methyltransferase